MSKHPLSILLAEDNEDHAKITIDTLEENASLGISVFHVSNGQLAIDYLESCNEKTFPDVVILDLKMPLKNGFEVLEYMKKDDQIKNIPVIILTTSSNKNDVQTAYGMGVSSLLVKPFSFDEFAEMLNSFTGYWTQVTLSSSTMRS